MIRNPCKSYRWPSALSTRGILVGLFASGKTECVSTRTMNSI